MVGTQAPRNLVWSPKGPVLAAGTCPRVQSWEGIRNKAGMHTEAHVLGISPNFSTKARLGSESGGTGVGEE